MRSSVGCALIIPMIIQMIGLYPLGAVWTDEASNVSRPDRSGADQIDAERQATDLAVGVRIPRGAHQSPRSEATFAHSGADLRPVQTDLVGSSSV